MVLGGNDMDVGTLYQAKAGDQQSISVIIEKYMPLIKNAGKLSKNPYDGDDFKSEAMIGIWDAIRRFDPSRILSLSQKDILSAFTECVCFGVFCSKHKLFKSVKKDNRIRFDSSDD